MRREITVYFSVIAPFFPFQGSQSHCIHVVRFGIVGSQGDVAFLFGRIKIGFDIAVQNS